MPECLSLFADCQVPLSEKTFNRTLNKLVWEPIYVIDNTRLKVINNTKHWKILQYLSGGRYNTNDSSGSPNIDDIKMIIYILAIIFVEFIQNTSKTLFYVPVSSIKKINT